MELSLRNKVLALLKKNARMPLQEMADRLQSTPEAIQSIITELEKENLILGYTAIVNDTEATDEVRAIIEVQVTPERDAGFDNVALRLAQFPEVTAMFLVSGKYDLRLEVVGKSLQDVASFVSGKLACQDGVKSTATYFMLKKYKECGICFTKEEKNERLKIVP